MRTRSTMHSRVKSRSCDNYLSIKVSGSRLTSLMNHTGIVVMLSAEL